jgi:hypothetical protein
LNLEKVKNLYRTATTQKFMPAPRAGRSFVQACATDGAPAATPVRPVELGAGCQIISARHIGSEVARRKRSLSAIDPRPLLPHDLSKRLPFAFRILLQQHGLCGSLIGSGGERQSVGKIAAFCLPLHRNSFRNKLCA